MPQRRPGCAWVVLGLAVALALAVPVRAADAPTAVTSPPPNYNQAISEAGIALDREVNDGSIRAAQMALDAPALAQDPPASPPATSTAVSSSPLTNLPPVSSFKAPKNEVAVSADFLYGQGNVTMPFLFSLQRVPNFSTLVPFVASPPRQSTYEGTTLSYSRVPSWSLDLSYAQGSSSGNVLVGDPANRFPNTQTHFSIDDTYYQAYVRYVPRRFLTTPILVYFRAGISYVDATLQDDAFLPPPINKFEETDKTTDLLGNVGFGLGRFLTPGSRRLRIAVQLEGEGFFGDRNQKSTETLPDHAPPLVAPTASINNTLYGGIGRGTVRFQWAFGQGLLKAYADVGAAAKYTQIQYPSSGAFPASSFSELLWGPYIKVGLRYTF